MSTKNKIIVGVVYSVVLLAIGYYLAPEKIKIEKETSHQEAKTEKTDSKEKSDVSKDKKLKRERINKDGSKVITTVYTEDTSTKKTTDKSKADTTTSVVQDHTKETKLVESSKGKMSISALGGVQLFGGPAVPVYGGMVQRSLFGPFTMGLWGISNGIVGASA